MHKLIATCFGIGYITKGGGTAASVFCCICMYGLFRLGVTITPAMGLIVALLLVIIGIWAGNKVEPLWGKDNYRVVIDEVAGMWISMLFAPLTFISLLAGLILFRFFDILKPLYIRRMEKLPGGTGVMMDDVLAGAYSCIALQILARLTDLK